MKNILLIIALFLAICSCSKNDDLEEIVVEDKYIPVLQDTEYDQIIYDFYNKYNTAIIYDFDKTVYDWKIVGDGTLEYDTLVYVQNKEVLPQRLDFIVNDWMSAYSEDFLKEKLSRRILLLDTIERVNEYGPTGEVYLAKAGINYVAVSNMGDSFDLVDKQDLINELNVVLINDFIISNGILTVSNKFFEVSGFDLYGKYRASNGYNENGFFNQYEWWGGMGYYFPKQETDLRDYINFYFKTPADQVEVLIGAYPKMMEKYGVIKNFIEDSNIFK